MSARKPGFIYDGGVVDGIALQRYSGENLLRCSSNDTACAIWRIGGYESDLYRSPLLMPGSKWSFLFAKPMSSLQGFSI